MIYALDGVAPEIDADTWIAPGAHVMGRVVLEAGASLWFGACLRGDNEEIRVGAGANIQENCVLHTDPGYPIAIGADCTIGHKAMLHGCTIGAGALVAARRRERSVSSDVLPNHALSLWRLHALPFRWPTPQQLPEESLSVA